ncbi:hypothetical protein NUW58_g2181 [Xylaria curta]|uniref:Uncharacterized protein n=1 Tax=Xylaria curta TaxID=42375 RepID=A0ACC1PK26_9PEZI|nr:hypothetical protein NUW58_g2181 [Xylaria curta]
MPDPYYDDDDDRHESADEYASRPKYPKHGPHGAHPPPGTCHRFPYQSYMAEQALCGADNLEIDGIYGFTHLKLGDAAMDYKYNLEERTVLRTRRVDGTSATSTIHRPASLYT